MASLRKGKIKKFHIKKDDGYWHHYLGVASWLSHDPMLFIALDGGGLIRIPASEIRCYWCCDYDTDLPVENHGIDLVGLTKVHLEFHEDLRDAVYLARMVRITHQELNIDLRGGKSLKVPKKLLKRFKFIEYYKNTGLRHG